MASFDIVNYSLRPSKSIQRQIVFDGIRRLKGHLPLDRLVYVGFGSIWFTDFVLAHKMLGIDDMISIEQADVGYSRAVFNAPYATIKVRHGFSSQILPDLYGDANIAGRPWMIWLDFDREFDEALKDDIRSVVENVSENSILLVTFDAKEGRYGEAQERPERLRALFGEVVPENLTKEACKDDSMRETLAKLALDFMKSVAGNLSRPGGFVPAVRVIYKDTAPMVTVGGLLPSKGAARIATDLVNEQAWQCMPAKPIIAPHLTMREAAILQSKLPRLGGLNREVVKSLGFDLEDDQIEVFDKYYREYPAFAQIIG